MSFVLWAPHLPVLIPGQASQAEFSHRRELPIFPKQIQALHKSLLAFVGVKKEESSKKGSQDRSVQEMFSFSVAQSPEENINIF